MLLMAILPPLFTSLRLGAVTHACNLSNVLLDIEKLSDLW